MTQQLPPSHAVEGTNRPKHRRAVFSKSYRSIESHHAQSPDQLAGQPQAAARSKVHHDDSMQLIDDLINRPYDALYGDARLGVRPTSGVRYWYTRIVVFVICVAVGFYACLFVRQLNTDPRKEVRESLASQLETNTDEVRDLNKQIEQLRTQIDQQNTQHGLSAAQRMVQHDDMTSGLLPVEGPGITMSLANSVSAQGTSINAPADGSAKIRVITDTDLQQLVSLLWQGGAEAIAINGHRLGAQTSIRTAAGSILIGTDPVHSPYRIQAIGNADALAEWMGSKHLAALYDSYNRAGIHPEISKERMMRLNAATAGGIVVAQRSE
ncbi:hypothetical protein BGLCM_1072 [Bifidobacterium gallicum DSM 20093 = LMG 11596]|uniref:DUF881 domain-containing protein n=2 Tax=Bifidobacterium gallicum DSM 20093 = LMG 11596 TaxID=561180 RepID=A0A087AJ28_9BIFI|nr:hypothetical protein BGLCM_1072 [Bifidobacterium gallicum DSM 20093 = LMG 11596]